MGAVGGRLKSTTKLEYGRRISRNGKERLGWVGKGLDGVWRGERWSTGHVGASLAPIEAEHETILTLASASPPLAKSARVGTHLSELEREGLQGPGPPPTQDL